MKDSTKHTARQALSRREAITLIASIMGCAFVGNVANADESVMPATGRVHFSDDEVTLLSEIGDTIIPQTDTPGAKAVNIGAFMAMMVNDCYDQSQQMTFRAGLTSINERCKSTYQKSFVEATAEQRLELLSQLDREQQSTHDSTDSSPHYFRMMKQLTLLGFFTSEVGATQVLNYVEVPGRYDGNAPYAKGDRAWYVAPSSKLEER